jgi:hypothetical protein
MGVAKSRASRAVLISGSLLVAACSSSGGGSTPGGGTPPTTTIDEKEPNDGPTAAGAQDIGTFGDDVTIVIKGTLATGGVDTTKYTGDLDVFAFELTQNGSLDISVDWTGSADVDFALYDAAVKTVASDGTTAKPAKGTLGSAKGKYLLGLFSKDQAATYTATLVYKKTTGTTPPPGDCPTTPVAAAAPTGGCNISLTTPVCATADLTGGKDFELAWSTNMTFCEGPHKIQVGGDPPSTWTTGNALEWSVASTSTSDRAQMTRDSGGFVKFNASEIAALTSASGIYYYRVVSFYGSASEARAFRVVK